MLFLLFDKRPTRKLFYFLFVVLCFVCGEGTLEMSKCFPNIFEDVLGTSKSFIEEVAEESVVLFLSQHLLVDCCSRPCPFEKKWIENEMQKNRWLVQNLQSNTSYDLCYFENTLEIGRERFTTLEKNLDIQVRLSGNTPEPILYYSGNLYLGSSANYTYRLECKGFYQKTFTYANAKRSLKTSAIYPKTTTIYDILYPRHVYQVLDLQPNDGIVCRWNLEHNIWRWRNHWSSNVYWF